MTIYICGDSFSVSDPPFGPNWPDLLANQLHNHQIVNLSSPGASNYLIYLQVKEALKNNCNYIIYQSTSSIRHEFLIKEDCAITDSVHRYYNSTNPIDNATMVCGSWHDLGRHYSKVLENKHINNIAKFSAEFIDLPSSIEKNYIYIVHTLTLLANANLRGWAWSRGGFEHRAFSKTSEWDFEEFSNHECPVNLWDHYDPKVIRPIYHVTDKAILQNVCNQYIKMLEL